MEKIAQEQAIGRDKIEVWFADEARIGPKNKITGRKSEKSDPDQFDLALEDLETAMETMMSLPAIA